ncbi:hypothetical protein B0181_03140 [Moraxella caviae]|uniref:dihydrofolate reductase n=1 Tax=Moraxella caviae TaxID=34060 RepID=A0A1T0A6F4_9GAMM|nr:hypothetical protein B0181_03140 [Moraxella caviae]STZ13921.1 Dihydrofolate reductase type 3 [Moraxella caviae]
MTSTHSTEKNSADSTHIDVVHIVACDRNHCIGKDNQLAWHLPADLQHFKTLTTGGVIVMGRKTFDSLGRLLPKRSHHVITRDTTWQADGVKVAHSLADAIAHAKVDAAARGLSEIFIIGGGEIYAQSLALADRLEITRVDLSVDGDAFYPADLSDFVLTWQSDTQSDEKSGVQFYFTTYTRQNDKSAQNSQGATKTAQGMNA